MNVNCEQLEAILERQDAAELAALAVHAEQCAACALQLRLEQEISAAAPALRKDWPANTLWPRIERALAAERKTTGNVWAIPPTLRGQWRLAAAAVALMMVTASAAWFALSPKAPTGGLQPAPVVIGEDQRLLNEKAMKEVESAEAAYVESIDRLAALAAPKLKQPETALLSNYREKLLVLDSAIRDIRAQADGNRFNAHLRKELLEVYQAKQQTLTQLLQEEVR